MATEPEAVPRVAAAEAAGRPGSRVLRFGILGTGRVAPYALIQPARQTPGVAVAAVASRQADTARAFAAAHAIPRAHESYASLLGASDIDAVYIALPTSLHAPWVRQALEAGKDVLCEKPLAANADEAATLVRLARDRGRMLHEGMHLRYLSRLQQQRALVSSGELGPVRRIRSWFRLPRIPMPPGDFRLDYSLGGGAALDVGCYAVNCARFVMDGEPTVDAVRHRTVAPGVDRWMRAQVRFPGAVPGVIECGFRGWYLPRVDVQVVCERGWVRWTRDGLACRRGGRTTRLATVPDWTYQRQLEAFIASCRGEPSEAVPPDDAVRTLRVLDAMYQAAGLSLRQSAD